MSDKNFDEFLKRSFSDYEPHVPSHIWENIAAGRKKKKPAGFWLTERKALLAIAGLLLLGTGVYLGSNKKNADQIIAHEDNGSRQGTGQSAPAAVLQDKHTNDLASSNDNSIDRSSATNETATVHADNAVNKPAGTTANTVASGNRTGEEKPLALPAGKNNSKHPPKKTRNYRLVAVSTDSPDPGDNDLSQFNNNGTGGNELNIPYVAYDKEMLLLTAQSNLPKQTIQLFAPANKKTEDCPGAPGNKYYIEAYISPDYAIKKYSDTIGSTLVAKRKESLRFHSAFSAGIRYTRVFNNGMSIRAGINYSQINEKFSYAQDNVVQIIYVINTQGDTTDSYYVRGTRYKTSYNHYRTIDIPLTVGYEMGGDKFRANINAGPVINIYSWQKGETLDNNGAPVSITTGKDDSPYQYKTNLGVGFTAGASLYYRLNDRFHAMAEPYFRYNFTPMNKETLSIQEKFTTIGLRLGIRMDIK